MVKMVWYQNLHKCHGKIYKNESNEDVTLDLKLREELLSPVPQAKYEYESFGDDISDLNRKEHQTPAVQDNESVFADKKYVLPEIKGQDWLVGCFRFNGPLRQYFSLYWAVS